MDIAPRKKSPNPILLAASKTQPEIISAILAHRVAPKIDVNERDADGCTALAYLVARGTPHKEASQAIADLIAAGARTDEVVSDPNAHELFDKKTGISRKPQHHLAQLALRQYSSHWKHIFEHMGPKKLKACSENWPLLHDSLNFGHIEAAEKLLAAGANPNFEHPELGLPISSCSGPRDFSMLVASGAKLNLPDSKGRTALQIISSSGASPEVLAMATAAAQAESQGARAVFKEGVATGKTKASDDIAQPLIEALFDSIARRKKDRIDNLWKTLNLGRDKNRLVEARDKKGRTLLHAAMSSRSFSLAKRLIGRGLDPNAFDDAGSTPLSIILGLSLDNIEKDRYGKKRKEFAAAFMEKINWNARDGMGRGYYEALFNTEIEYSNGFEAAYIHDKATASRGDWLEKSPDAQSCLLSRVIGLAIAKGHPSYSSLYHSLNSKTTLPSLLTEQLSRPEFDAQIATMLLKSTLGEARENALRYPSTNVKEALLVIEKNMPKFAELGVDPEAIAWAKNLGESLPTVASAIESWRLSNISRNAGPRMKARSL